MPTRPTETHSNESHSDIIINSNKEKKNMKTKQKNT